jgi:hypothetical protein
MAKTTTFRFLWVGECFKAPGIPMIFKKVAPSLLPLFDEKKQEYYDAVIVSNPTEGWKIGEHGRFSWNEVVRPVKCPKGM